MAAQLGDVFARVPDVTTNVGAEFHHRLVHFGFDALIERDLAVVQNLLDVRAQLARLWINDGKLLLDAEGEHVVRERICAHRIKGLILSA